MTHDTREFEEMSFEIDVEGGPDEKVVPLEDVIRVNHQQLQKAREEGRQSVLDELEEEQKKFTQGFAYKAPDRPLNHERE